VLPLRLIRIAMEAEAMRLNHKAKRTVVRLVLACCAAVLLLGALAFLHVAVWFWLRESLAVQYVALIFAAVDLVIGVILAVLADRYAPGEVELEALAVRRRALDDATDSLTISASLVRLLEQWIFRQKG